MLKLSCVDNMVPGDTLEKKAEFLHKAGYDAIAVYCDYREWKDEMLFDMQTLRERTGIKVCEFVFTGPLYGHLMDKDINVRKEAIKIYEWSIAVANELGAITEMEYEYRTQDPLPLFEPYLTMPSKEAEYYNGILNTLGPQIKDGAYMLIEPCNRYESKYMTTLKACMERIEAADSSKTARIGLLADFFHMAIEEDNLEENIVKAGKYIKHVHLGDSNRLAPGYGHTDWKAGMRALKTIGFNGYMNLECKLPGDPAVILPQVREYLEKF